MFTTALTFILGASAAGWILARLKMIAIIAAAFVVTNAASGVIGYIKGHNKAAIACRLNDVVRQRDEALRDLKIARDLAPKVQAELDRQRDAIAKHDKETAEYAERISKAEQRAREAEERAAKARPANCPACPPSRPCVVD